MSSDVNSLAHSKWNCKYHIVFAPKYRRQIIYGKIKQDIGQILRQLCERKGVEIIEATACKDHIHMLVSIPPKISVSSFVGYLKGKSSLMIFDRHAHLKYRYGNRKFWCKGFYVDTVGRNKKVIEEYIRNQIQDDIVADQLSMEEFIDPFTGQEVKRKNKKNRRNPLGLAGKVVRLANFQSPLKGWPVTKAFSRRTNHPFLRVVMIMSKRE